MLYLDCVPVSMINLNQVLNEINSAGIYISTRYTSAFNYNFAHSCVKNYMRNYSQLKTEYF